MVGLEYKARTDMAKGIDMPKLDPNEVASIALNAVQWRQGWRPDCWPMRSR
ncbi:MAG: hypothetical protein ABI619_08550 [Betaproteobacteria bacterium]